MRKSLFNFLMFLVISCCIVQASLLADYMEKPNPFHPEAITEHVEIVGKIPDDVETIIDSMNHPIRYKRAGAPLPKGILMLGAPGVGKTTIAKFIAEKTECQIIMCSAARLIDTYCGTGPAAVDQIFDAARQCIAGLERQEREPLERLWWEQQQTNPKQRTQPMPAFNVTVKPVIIFFDEIDSIACKRANLKAGGGDQELRNTLNELFQQMEGAHASENIIVIAATNEDEGFLDPAFLSRFTYVAHVPLPEAADRLQILRLYSLKCVFSPGVSLDCLASDQYTAGYSGRDLKKLVEHIARIAASDKKLKDDEVAIKDEHITVGHTQFAERKRLEVEAELRRIN